MVHGFSSVLSPHHFFRAGDEDEGQVSEEGGVEAEAGARRGVASGEASVEADPFGRDGDDGRAGRARDQEEGRAAWGGARRPRPAAGGRHGEGRRRDVHGRPYPRQEAAPRARKPAARRQGQDGEVKTGEKVKRG